MNVLLAAINAKYIHSNLAVYSLKAYAEEKWDSEAGQKEIQEDTKPIIAIAEYTINQTVDQILMDLYRRKPDMLCFSCYLWNIEYVEHLLREIPEDPAEDGNLARRTGSFVECQRDASAIPTGARRDAR